MKFYLMGTILFLMIITGCTSFEVQVIENPEKNYKTVLLSMYHKVIQGDMDNWEVVYRRKIKEDKRLPAIVSFTFYADPYHRGLDRKVYVKVDDKKYRAVMRYRKSVIERETVGGIGSTASSSTILDTKDRWKKLSGKILIYDAIEKAIDSSKQLEYYIYTGGKLTIIKATEDQAVKVREFFQTGKKVEDEPDPSQ